MLTDFILQLTALASEDFIFTYPSRYELRIYHISLYYQADIILAELIKTNPTDHGRLLVNQVVVTTIPAISDTGVTDIRCEFVLYYPEMSKA